MNRVPRDSSGTEVVNALRKLGYLAVRQAGSHIRLTTAVNGEHHGLTRSDCLELLFG